MALNNALGAFKHMCSTLGWFDRAVCYRLDPGVSTMYLRARFVGYNVDCASFNFGEINLDVTELEDFNSSKTNSAEASPISVGMGSMVVKVGTQTSAMS